MSERRKRRCKHEMMAAMLDELDEETPMNKNQIRIATGIGGQHLNAMVNKCVDLGLMEWTGEVVRPLHGERYGQKLKTTDRGRQWVEVWKLLKRVEDPGDKIRVTIQNREKNPIN